MLQTRRMRLHWNYKRKKNQCKTNVKQKKRVFIISTIHAVKTHQSMFFNELYDFIVFSQILNIRQIFSFSSSLYSQWTTVTKTENRKVVKNAWPISSVEVYYKMESICSIRRKLWLLIGTTEKKLQKKLNGTSTRKTDRLGGGSHSS